MNKTFREKYDVVENISHEQVEEFYGEGYSDFLGNLLHARGVTNRNDAEVFLQPTWESIHAPFLFSDMKKSVERVLYAIENNQNILIFSDYDTDGIPGGALLYKFFEKIEYKNFANYIPNRNRDGYGLSVKKAKLIVEGKVLENTKFENELETVGEETEKEKEGFLPQLVITVDCGITDNESADLLKENGIDLIVTDHHIAKETLPDAFAILNHKVPGESYPDKNLCGCGIAFKLVQGLSSTLLKQEKEKEFKNIKVKNIHVGWEKWLLDLVAISTVCDMVPLVGENRTLVRYGQLVLNKTRNRGLQKIIEKSRIDKNNISAQDLGFMIGPRINAASRLADPFYAFEALARNTDEATEAAQYLETLNNRRKYATAKIMKEVWKRLADRELGEVIVIGNKEWPLGILGLVAGKIADKYARPAFVWSQADGDEGGKLKGSCRSGSHFSIYSLMSVCGEHFLGFGGHSASGGFEISQEKVHGLEQELIEGLGETEKIENKKKVVDSKITIDDITLSNYRDIEKLEPYGMANQQPHFFISGAEVASVKEFGKENGHLELSFKNSRGYGVKAIQFFYKDVYGDRKFNVGDKLDVIVSFEMNRWGGKEFLRLKIEDIV